MLCKKAMGGEQQPAGQLPPGKAPSPGGHATRRWVVQSATLDHCHNQAYFMSLYKADKDWEGGGLPATVGWV